MTTEISAHLEGPVGGRKSGLERAKKVLLLIPCWAQRGSHWFYFWFQLDSVWLGPPREFVVNVQVLAEHISPEDPTQIMSETELLRFQV